MSLSLHRFDLQTLRAAEAPLVSFPTEKNVSRLRWVDAGAPVELGVAWLGEEWGLSDTRELLLNHLAPPPFVRLRHGDVVVLRDGAVMVVDATQTWPRDARFERTASGAREVLHDWLVEHGRVGPWSGELHALIGRGLSVEHLEGFPHRATLDLRLPMTRAWPERWARLLVDDPAWAFLAQVAFDAFEPDDAAWLEVCTQTLVERGVEVQAHEARGEPDEPLSVSPEREDVRLFDQPIDSSWLTRPLPRR